MQGELHYLLLKCFRGSHKFIVQETSKISLLPGLCGSGGRDLPQGR